MSTKTRKHLTDEQLLAYLDGELPVTDVFSIRNHLKICWECRSTLHDLEHQIEAASRFIARSIEQDEQRTAATKRKLLRWIRQFESRRPPSLYRKMRQYAVRWFIYGSAQWSPNEQSSLRLQL